jgi:hypothetical protein
MLQKRNTYGLQSSLPSNGVAMMKIFSLIFMLILSLSGCSKESNSSAAKNKQPDAMTGCFADMDNIYKIKIVRSGDFYIIDFSEKSGVVKSNYIEKNKNNSTLKALKGMDEFFKATKYTLEPNENTGNGYIYTEFMDSAMEKNGGVKYAFISAIGLVGLKKIECAK